MTPKSTWAETVAAMSGRTVEDIHDWFEDRAAQREFAGGFDRAEAERWARLDVESMVLRDPP